MKNNLILLLLSIALLSCANKKDFIIPVDFEKFEKEIVPGLNQEEVKGIISRQIEEIKINSIGKHIPKIFVKDKSGQEIILQNVLFGNNVIALTDAHCSWGNEGLTNDLQFALKELEKEKIKPVIICLLIKEKSDYNDTTKFLDRYNNLGKLYDNFYVIDRVDANKLNVFANPTRLYFDKNLKLKNYKIGVSTPRKRYVEMKKNCC